MRLRVHSASARRRRTKGVRTEVEEEELGHVRAAVVAAEDEEV